MGRHEKPKEQPTHDEVDAKEYNEILVGVVISSVLLFLLVFYGLDFDYGI